MKKNPYVLVDSITNIVVASVSGRMDLAFNKAFRMAEILAGKTGHNIAVVADPYGYKKGTKMTQLFYHLGPYILVTPDGEIINKNPKQNIAAKTRWTAQGGRGTPIPYVYARHQRTPKPYPMAGALRRQQGQMSQEEFRRMARDKMDQRLMHISNPYGSDEPEYIQCPVCGGPGGYMGTLGKYDWFRCRQCGIDFRSEAQINPASIDRKTIAIYSTKGGAHLLVVTIEFDGCYGIEYIDHQRHTGGSAGLCSKQMLNDKLTELIYYADRIDGVKYELIFPKQSHPGVYANPRRRR